MKTLDLAPEPPEEDILPLALKKTGQRSILQRRSMPSPEKGNDIWLYTLSDLLLLLVVFFVLLFGMSLRPTKPTPQMISSSSPPHPVVRVQGQAPISGLTHQEMKQKQQETLESELYGLLSREREEEEITIKRTPDHVTLTFPENIIFDPGRAVLKPYAQPILDKVASFVLERPHLMVEVHGHADDRPIHNKRYPSNWELSVDRATQVARTLIGMGVDPIQVSVRGFGEYRSLLPNDSEENRLKNRRVEIQFLLPSLSPT